MQPLVLHPPSLTSTQFGQPRFTGPGLPFTRPWSNARGCSPRAPLSRQSMSGSPPAEPSVTSGESNPPIYPPAPAPVAATSAEATANLPGPSQPLPPPPVSEPLAPPVLSRYGEPNTPVFANSPQLPPGAPAYPLPALDPSASGSASRALTQKSTRRTKAHVASACVNCKKKHLGCDPARPCRRCVLAGKASSCVDVTHKKRGRPPLKAEDSSLRTYSTHMDNPTVPAEVQLPGVAPRAGVMHRATSSRELRPMTDLQVVGETGPAAAMRAPRGQPHRWSASVFPLTRPMDPSAGPGTAGRRPFSSSGPPTYTPPAHPPPAFAPITSTFNPALKPGVIPPGLERRYQPYPGPALPPPTSPPQHHSPAGVPLIPYAEAPPSSMHHPIPEPRLAPGYREPYPESPVRLPPIHQATASPGLPPRPPPPPGPPHHAHRLSDPYPATWTASAREENPREPRSPAPLHRPMGSMFSHSTPHQRSTSTTGPLDPVPRHLGPIDLPPSAPLVHSPQVSTAAPPRSEAEDSEQRPVKRRKMALDDMVNG